MTVEQQIEFNLSPRAKDTIAYMDAHEGGYVEPTHPTLATHDESRMQMSDDDRAELVKFDAIARYLNATRMGFCSNL